MKQTKGSILLRFVTFAFIIAIISIVYQKYFYESDLKKHSDLITILNEIPNNVDILYVAESSNTAFHKNDTEKKTIAEFLDKMLPDQKVEDLTKPAAHAGIFKYLLKRIPEESQIKTLIVTLNLRSFNAQWIHSSLETSLQKSLVFIRPNPPIVNRFLLSFKAYPIKSKQVQEAAFKAKWQKDELKFPYDFPHKNVMQWDKWMAKKGIKNKDGTKNQPLTELACHYIKGYGFQIDTLNNPRIKDFNDIIKYAKLRGWDLVFNLLAENVEKANELVGKDLTFLMDQNRKLLINYFKQKNVLVIDNLEAIPSQYFIDQNWTTEHYSDFGRKKIAENIAKGLKFSSN